MKEKLQFVRLPILLFIVFFVGKLIVGATMGVSKESYDLSNRLFSMVILQVHIGLLWGAVGRRYRGYRIMESVQAVMIAVAASQILIFLGTTGSYALGAKTLFTFPEALNAETARTFSEALTSRTITFVVNCVVGGILGAIGWSLGNLIPAGPRNQSGMRA